MSTSLAPIPDRGPLSKICPSNRVSPCAIHLLQHQRYESDQYSYPASIFFSLLYPDVMSSQGASRKRPAPGTNPEVSQQMPLVPNYDSVDSQLSNDQFLQWGQNGQNTNIINLDLPSYVGRNSSFGLESHDQVGNQLARRPVNNSVNRTRLSDPNLLTLNDQGDQSDGRTAETDAIMEQKALIAKKEAQEKRRQIPPFVQKLRRYG